MGADPVTVSFDDDITGVSEITTESLEIKTDGRTIRNPGPKADPEAQRRFQMFVSWESNRDQWGRPNVRLPDSKTEVGYRRASNYGAPNESTYLLELWKLRQVAQGVAMRPALGLAITRCTPRLRDPDPAVAKKAKKELDALCQQAMDAVGSGDLASIGTSLHDVLEADDLTGDPGYVPDDYLPDLYAYRQMRKFFVTLSSERIIVEDRYRVGGTYDRAIELLFPMTTPTGDVLAAGTVLIGDIKTSQTLDFAGCKFGIQVLEYATGQPYDPIDKVRYGWGHEAPRTDWAVILHVPSGKGQAAFRWVDLRHYARAAADVKRTHNWRNTQGKKGIMKGRTFEDYGLTCQLASSVEELFAAHARAIDNEEWTEELRALFAARRAELEGTAPDEDAA